jgi:2-polyprenyl-3-methyl-5-hydroxy-6-metoxy-1,4-benzoquinol methylase
MNISNYNVRLFSGGIRAFLHRARYIWLQREITKKNIPHSSVLELGCFDAKTINYLPEKPHVYVGYDANWENGLDIAKENWKKYGYVFNTCTTAGDFKPSGLFDISISLETLEHLPPKELGAYLKILSEVTKGYVFVSVPNEKGIVFFFKFLLKHLIHSWGSLGENSYTFREFFFSCLGMTSRVNRDQHKGFNYKDFIEEMGAYFDILAIESLPISFFPPWLSFGIGILAKPKQSVSNHE